MDGEATDLRGQYVSCNYLAAHPRRVLLGRGFIDLDCASERAPVALLTERGWSTRFGRRDSVVGSVVRLNNQDVFVIGVAEDARVGDPVAPLIFVPFTLQSLLEPSQNLFRSDPGRVAWLNLTGRLAKGRTRREAEAELQALATAIDRRRPQPETTITAGNVRLELVSARRSFGGRTDTLRVLRIGLNGQLG